MSSFSYGELFKSIIRLKSVKHYNLYAIPTSLTGILFALSFKNYTWCPCNEILLSSTCLLFSGLLFSLLQLLQMLYLRRIIRTLEPKQRAILRHFMHNLQGTILIDQDKEYELNFLVTHHILERSTLHTKETKFAYSLSEVAIQYFYKHPFCLDSSN